MKVELNFLVLADKSKTRVREGRVFVDMTIKSKLPGLLNFWLMGGFHPDRRKSGWRSPREIGFRGKSRVFICQIRGLDVSSDLHTFSFSGQRYPREMTSFISNYDF